MRSRPGFTLIELMVAMALTLFVMVIISQAFITALDTFSGLKAVGDMQMALRTASASLRVDLNQDHLDGKRRLSDPTLTTNPPREGFFVIYQGGNSITEGTDADGVSSYYATNHVLHFSTKLRTNRRESFFRASVKDATFFTLASGFDTLSATDGVDATLTTGQANTFGSPWAEVVYFLAPTGRTTDGNSSSTQLYNLYRAQFVVVPSPGSLTNPNPGTLNANSAKFTLGNFTNLACNSAGASGGVLFFSPADLATGHRTVTPSTVATDTRVTPVATLLLPNVISFQVRGMVQNATSHSWYYQDLNFDSRSANGVTLRGVEAVLRVWDGSTQQARQMTLMQDL